MCAPSRYEGRAAKERRAQLPLGTSLIEALQSIEIILLFNGLHIARDTTSFEIVVAHLPENRLFHPAQHQVAIASLRVRLFQGDSVVVRREISAPILAHISDPELDRCY